LVAKVIEINGIVKTGKQEEIDMGESLRVGTSLPMPAGRRTYLDLIIEDPLLPLSHSVVFFP